MEINCFFPVTVAFTSPAPDSPCTRIFPRLSCASLTRAWTSFILPIIFIMSNIAIHFSSGKGKHIGADRLTLAQEYDVSGSLIFCSGHIRKKCAEYVGALRYNAAFVRAIPRYTKVG